VRMALGAQRGAVYRLILLCSGNGLVAQHALWREPVGYRNARLRSVCACRVSASG
jgi:hypothetical protein